MFEASTPGRANASGGSAGATDARAAAGRPPIGIMKLVDRLVWRELIGPLVNSVLMFLLLIFSSAYLIKLTDLMAQGASLALVAKVALFSLPQILTQTLPMGMLLGTLLAFGRLSGDSEHIAMYACGVSFFRIVRPVAVAGVLVGCAAIVWNETVAPPATREFYRLSQDVIDQTTADHKPLKYDIYRPGSNVVDMIVLASGGYDSRTQSLYRVTIFKMSDDPRRQGEPAFAAYAERAKLRSASADDADFYNGYTADLRPPDPGKPYPSPLTFEQASTLPHGMRLGRSFKGILQAEVTDNRRMTFQELRDRITLKRKRNDPTANGDEFDLWSKISLPLATLIFGVVAAPLGLRPHRGSKAMGFGIAISLIFCYWMVHNGIMYQMAKNGQISPFVAAFAADAIGLIAGTLLVYRTRQ